MVGRKTSPRCDNCRRRKVKCDLAQPSCTQCINRKIHCPGYDTESRFFVYKKQQENASASSATSSPGGQSDFSSGATSRKKVDRLIVARAPALGPTDILRGDFVSRITQKNIAARFIVIPEQAILQHIPRRLGSNRALDDAVKCICSSGTTTPGAFYSEALSSLQRALNHAGQSVSSETLGAAILLQMFEHSVEHGEFRWVIHANGVINMLQLRGPSCIKNELDRAIVRAQVGNIWFKSMREGTDCFLATPEWNEVVADTFHTCDDVNAEWSAMIRSGLAIPGISRRYAELEIENDNRPPTSENASKAQDRANYPKLILDLWKTRDELSELRIRFQSLKEINFEDSCETIKLIEQPRLRHASRLAVNVFSILIEFMLENVLSTEAGDKAAHEDLFNMITMSGYVTTAGRLHALSSAAESSFKTLSLADDIAASQTAMLSKMMMQRVLDAPLTIESKVQYLKPIVENLYEALGGNAMDDRLKHEQS